MQNSSIETTLFDNLEFVERLESLMSGYESTEIEFKSAKGGFPGSFWETYSAFANTQGGESVCRNKAIQQMFMRLGAAKKIERSISHLKSQIIPQMLIDNLLERQFPDVPRHPHQKYRAIKK